MKKILIFLFIGSVCFFQSCQKSLSVVNSDNDGDTMLGDGTLLVRSVILTSDGTTTPTDSTVTEYSYNAAGLLIKQQTVGWEPIIYNRDLAGRLTSARAKTGTGDTAYTNVYYTGATGTQVAYVLFGVTNASAAPDSMSFSYSGGHVATTAYYSMGDGTPVLSYYQNWAFDGNGNVTQLNVYMADSTLNIGYDFEYDNKINPKYAADDARLPVEWGYTLSPDNVSKQTNRYGNPPVRPSDYVTYAYDFNTGGRPVTGLNGGTAIAPQTVETRFYYH